MTHFIEHNHLKTSAIPAVDVKSRATSDTKTMSGLANELPRGIGHNFGNMNVYSPTPISTNSPRIQPKLKINQPGDVYEQEADAMAEKVMRMPGASVNESSVFKPVISTIQRKCAACKEDEEEKLQRKTTDAEKQIQLKPARNLLIQKECTHCQKEEGNVQRKESRASVTPMISPAITQTLQSAGQPMDTATRSFMEQRFGHDFGQVQIHNDSLAHQSSNDIHARAYTHGSHVVFGAGQYQTQTLSGKQLLAHELTHVVQQTAAIKNNLVHKPLQSSVIQRQPQEENELEERSLTRPEEITLSRSSPGAIAGESEPLTLSLYNFGIDVPQPKVEHAAILTELALFLSATATARVTVRIIGFADSSGGSRHNLRLSRRRADAVKTLLQPAITQRISISAYGETNPETTNDTVEGRNRNRRVDIRFAADVPSTPQILPRPRPVVPGQAAPDPVQPSQPVPTPTLPDRRQPIPVPDHRQPIPVPPVTQPPGSGDDDTCTTYPFLCGAGLSPILPILACLIAPELCLLPLLPALPGLPTLPTLPGNGNPPPEGEDPPREPNERNPIVRFQPVVRALNTPMGMNDRIGIRDPVNVVAVVVNAPQPASPITIAVDGTGSNSGEATINGQQQVQITDTTPLSILGTRMSAEGYAYNPYLQLAAWWSNDLVGFSNRFSVSSIAENWSITFDGSEVTRDGYAFYIRTVWESDSGNRKDLSACRYVELVSVLEESGSMVGMGPGGVNGPDVVETGDFDATFDEHGTEHQQLTHSAGRNRVKQLFRIRDMRSNSGWAPSTNSGFIIERRFERDPGRPECWRLVVDKRGAAVTIDGMSSGAGAGHATHTFRNINCDPPPPRQVDPQPTPTPQHDNEPPQPVVPSGPPPCDRTQLETRVDLCIEQARQSAIDCSWALVHFSGGWGGIGVAAEYYSCIQDLRDALLECDRKAKEDTHCTVDSARQVWIA